MQLIRDISFSSAFWGATWTFGCFTDVHMIGDMPAGCFAMLSLAVTDYTDAVPHLENLTPTVIREEEVINGTSEALKRTIDNVRTRGYLEGKNLVVISSAESEMIGADHTNLLATLDPDARFFWSHSLEEDEWDGRDRALLFAWQEYGKPVVANDQPAAANRVNIIGPTLGCFNAPSDLHEVKRLIAGAGGIVNMVYPYEATIAATPELTNAAVNVVLYHEFGEVLAQELERPYLFAPFGLQGTTRFLRELGNLLGTPPEQVEAFIAQEKRTTLRPVWDLWRGTQSDWFSTLDSCIVAGRSYVDGVGNFLNNELGLKVSWSAGRPAKEGEPDNIAIRQWLHKKAPNFVFGSINERIYLAEAQSKSHFIPSAFPGPIVRRTTGTPFMGYAGAAHIMQEIVNHLYEMVLTILPVEPIAQEKSQGVVAHPTPGGKDDEHINWTDSATAQLNVVLNQLPYLERFSASRSLRAEAEQFARGRGLYEVTLDILEDMLARRE
jgi:chlorophyllide a reductase subunit Z